MRNRTARISATMLAISLAPVQQASAVNVSSIVNIVANEITALGGTIIGVGPSNQTIDFSNTNVAALGGNAYDETSFGIHSCIPGGSSCGGGTEAVRLRIGGFIDIDTTPGFAIVAPRVAAHKVATFVFDAPGTLELSVDTATLWDEDPLSGLAGSGISHYSFGQWQVVGTNGFSFGPTANEATGVLVDAQDYAFAVAAGTYTLFSPAVSVFMCAQSPSDGACGATDVPEPASLALFAAGLLCLGVARARRDPRRACR